VLKSWNKGRKSETESFRCLLFYSCGASASDPAVDLHRVEFREVRVHSADHSSSYIICNAT
jgi:hypothetical protein